MSLFQYFLLCIAILFPLYFWAYALKMLGESIESVRFKFWAGVFSGFISVGSVFIFQKFFPNFGNLIFIPLSLFFFYFLVWISSRFGSRFSAKFIQKSSLLHLLSIFGIFLATIIFSKILTDSFIFSGILATIFIPAFFEEISKHFSTLGLIAKRFSFSLREITLFAFCVVLGFVFVENILYLQKFGNNFWLAVFRSIFTFAIHLFSSLIAVLAWWKSLSYPFFSFKYFAIFSIGFFISSLVHFGMNFLLEGGNTIFLFPVTLCAYGLFVYLIKK